MKKPIMDEDDACRDLQNLCTEQRETITALIAEKSALAKALRDCLAPLQDAQNQLHHTRAAAAFINAKTILRES